MVEQGVGQMSPEDYKQWVKTMSEADIRNQVRAAGVEQTLDGLFQAMQESFLPDKAKGVDVVVQYLITDDGKEYAYTFSIKDGACTLKKEKAAAAKVTLTIELVSFLKLMGAAADGTQLYMAGKLKIGGDMSFAQRLAAFFKAT
jgi:putative sterol carrier protein